MYNFGALVHGQVVVAPHTEQRVDCSEMFAHDLAIPTVFHMFTTMPPFCILLLHLRLSPKPLHGLYTTLCHPQRSDPQMSSKTAYILQPTLYS